MIRAFTLALLATAGLAQTGCKPGSAVNVQVNSFMSFCSLTTSTGKGFAAIADACDRANGYYLTTVGISTQIGMPSVAELQAAEATAVSQWSSIDYYITGQAARSCSWNSWDTDPNCNGWGYIVKNGWGSSSQDGQLTDGNTAEMRNWSSANSVSVTHHSLPSVCVQPQLGGMSTGDYYIYKNAMVRDTATDNSGIGAYSTNPVPISGGGAPAPAPFSGTGCKPGTAVDVAINGWMAICSINTSGSKTFASVADACDRANGFYLTTVGISSATGNPTDAEFTAANTAAKAQWSSIDYYITGQATRSCGWADWDTNASCNGWGYIQQGFSSSQTAQLIDGNTLEYRSWASANNPGVHSLPSLCINPYLAGLSLNDYYIYKNAMVRHAITDSSGIGVDSTNPVAVGGGPAPPAPTPLPTFTPTMQPTDVPTAFPTMAPSYSPTPSPVTPGSISSTGCNPSSAVVAQVNGFMSFCSLTTSTGKGFAAIADACDRANGYYLTTVGISTAIGNPTTAELTAAEAVAKAQWSSIDYYITGQATRSCTWNSWDTDPNCNGWGYVADGGWSSSQIGQLVDGNTAEMRNWSSANSVSVTHHYLPSVCVQPQLGGLSASDYYIYKNAMVRHTATDGSGIGSYSTNPVPISGASTPAPVVPAPYSGTGCKPGTAVDVAINGFMAICSINTSGGKTFASVSDACDRANGFYLTTVGITSQTGIPTDAEFTAANTAAKAQWSSIDYYITGQATRSCGWIDWDTNPSCNGWGYIMQGFSSSQTAQMVDGNTLEYRSWASANSPGVHSLPSLCINPQLAGMSTSDYYIYKNAMVRHIATDGVNYNGPFSTNPVPLGPPTPRPTTPPTTSPTPQPTPPPVASNGCNPSSAVQAPITTWMAICSINTQGSKTFASVADACDRANGYYLTTVGISTATGNPTDIEFANANTNAKGQWSAIDYYITGQATRSCGWADWDSNPSCNGWGYIQQGFSSSQTAQLIDGDTAQYRNWASANNPGVHSLPSLCINPQLAGVPYTDYYIYKNAMVRHIATDGADYNGIFSTNPVPIGPSPTPLPSMPPTVAPTIIPTAFPTMVPTESPSESPTNMPTSPPTSTMTCSEIKGLIKSPHNLSALEMFNICDSKSYCKAKYQKKKDKAKCKKLKCKKCKKDQACCVENPEGCVYNPVERNPCS